MLCMSVHVCFRGIMAAPRGSPVIDKAKKYDRQLRLWGDHGQASLESANVCLVNATATGTETLKNLILPGIGSFNIVDGNKVKGEDVGNNFFLTKDSIGQARAQVAAELLQELNSDVRGDFVEESVEQLLESNPGFFKDFNVVIATDLPERTLMDLAAVLWDYDIPLLVCRCYGFIGYMRLAVKEHTVIESHPDNIHDDLRLDCPFPGLVDFASTFDLDAMSKQDHMHTPYLILLYKYLEKWKAEHNGEMPRNYREKSAFKELLRAGVRRNEHGAPEQEENFDEAIKAVNAALVQTGIPGQIRDLFSDPACTGLSAESPSYWILCQAVKQFTESEGNGALPLRGSIPDMTADSKRYIQLQNVYLEQSRNDVSAVSARVQQILASLGKSPDSIPDSEVRLFCKNAASLRVVRCRAIADEHIPQKANVADIALNLENPDSEMCFYVALRAVDRFFKQYNRYPGWYDDQTEDDFGRLKACASSLLQEWNISATVKEDYFREICRYGAAELHSVAAFIGGVAAQEIIKLVTRQFVPFKNTFIYNAVNGGSSTFQM